MLDHLNDPYVKLAQKEGYRSRAAYKLQEIDRECRLLKPGQTVVDLGAAPGAWSQYVQRTAPAARLIALDLLAMEPIDGVLVLQGDFREEATLALLREALGGRRVDLVISDMAPNLSGVESSDSARIADLVEMAIDFATEQLGPEGALVCKLFHGSGYSQLVKRFKLAFKSVKPYKPKASRDKSAETFVVGRGLKPP